MGIDSSKTVRFISDLSEYKQALDLIDYMLSHIILCHYHVNIDDISYIPGFKPMEITVISNCKYFVN